MTGWSLPLSRKMTVMREVCVACGDRALAARMAPFAFAHGSKQGVIEDDQTSCDSCGAISYVGEQISRHELAVAAKIREMDGLLSADDLRRIRLKYALRQTDLEAMLSVGPKTWTRWERGKVPQSKAADTLIRVLAEHPDVARALMEQAEIDNPEAHAVFTKIEADEKRIAIANLRAMISDRLVGVDMGQVLTHAIEAVHAARHGRGVKAA